MNFIDSSTNVKKELLRFTEKLRKGLDARVMTTITIIWRRATPGLS